MKLFQWLYTVLSESYFHVLFLSSYEKSHALNRHSIIRSFQTSLEMLYSSHVLRSFFEKFQQNGHKCLMMPNMQMLTHTVDTSAQGSNITTSAWATNDLEQYFIIRRNIANSRLEAVDWFAATKPVKLFLRSNSTLSFEMLSRASIFYASGQVFHEKSFSLQCFETSYEFRKVFPRDFSTKSSWT